MSSGLVTVLAHTARQPLEQSSVGANALNVHLVAASIVGHTALGTLWQTRNRSSLREHRSREQRDERDCSGEHDERVEHARLSFGGIAGLLLKRVEFDDSTPRFAVWKAENYTTAGSWDEGDYIHDTLLPRQAMP